MYLNVKQNKVYKIQSLKLIGALGKNASKIQAKRAKIVPTKHK